MRLLAILTFLAAGLATPPPVSTSRGFHVLLVPHDGSPARSLSMIHTGAGQSRAVAGGEPSVDDELVFYQNATGEAAGISTDILPQGFPMSLSFGKGAGEGKGGGGVMWPVDVTVSGPTTGLFVSEEEYDPWVAYAGGGAFWVCEQWVEYYRAVYLVLNWSGAGDPEEEDCVRVGVIPVCEALEELPDDAIGSHDFVAEVRCFVDDQSASLSTRG